MSATLSVEGPERCSARSGGIYFWPPTSGHGSARVYSRHFDVGGTISAAVLEGLVNLGVDLGLHPYQGPWTGSRVIGSKPASYSRQTIA